MTHFIPLVVVAGLLAFHAVRFPYVAKGRASIEWQAAKRYFTGAFGSSGFAIECDIDSGACGVTWTPPSARRSQAD